MTAKATGSSVVPLGSVARWHWCWSRQYAHAWLQVPAGWQGLVAGPCMMTLTVANVCTWRVAGAWAVCQACTCVAAGARCQLKYSSAGWWQESEPAAYRCTATEDPLPPHSSHHQESCSCDVMGPNCLSQGDIISPPDRELPHTPALGTPHH